MRNIEEFNQFGTTGITGLMMVLSERIDDRCAAAMKTWYEDDARETNAYSSNTGSAQSHSHYWTVGDDNFEHCLRLSEHKVVNCVSAVSRNINVMDFFSVETDDWGDEIWTVNYDAVCEAVDAGISELLGKIA